MPGLLCSVGLLVCRYRLRVLSAWVLADVVLVGLAALSGGRLVDGFTIPGTQAHRGTVEVLTTTSCWASWRAT